MLGENPAGHSVALLMLNKKFAVQVGGDGVVLAGDAGVVLAGNDAFVVGGGVLFAGAALAVSG